MKSIEMLAILEVLLDFLMRVCRITWDDIRRIAIKRCDPDPDSVMFYTGKAGSIEEALVLAAQDMCTVPTVSIQTLDDGNDMGSVPWLQCSHEDGDTERIVGTMAVCRFVGRLERRYPSPRYESGLEDARLEVLLTLLASHTPSCVKLALDRLLALPDACYDNPTLADIVWGAALTWLKDKSLLDECGEELLSHPCIARLDTCRSMETFCAPLSDPSDVEGDDVDGVSDRIDASGLTKKEE